METQELEIRKKISYAITNMMNLSKDELLIIYKEALDYGKKLPLRERGVFFWESGMECLTMVVSALERTENQK